MIKSTESFINLNEMKQNTRSKVKC